MNMTSTFGLTPKTNTTSNGDFNTLNYKVKVKPEFYQRWNDALAKLGSEYDGGGTAVIKDMMEKLLPELESLAKDIQVATRTKKKVGSI